MDFYKTLSCESRQFPEASAFVTGMGSIFFNVLFDERRDKSESKMLARAAAEYFNHFRAPWAWFMMPADINNDLTSHDFVLLEESPAMYFNLAQSIPVVESTHVIKEVESNDDLSEWIIPVNDAFHVEDGDDSYQQLNAAVLQNNAKKLRHFVAYSDGKLAGSATLFVSQDAVMLHNLATKTEFRNNGIGTALTLHMLAAAKKMGYVHCFLDASAVAFSLYQKLGFKVYSSTLIYAKT